MSLDVVLEALRPLLGDRLQTGASLRAQHANTVTWLAPELPDAVLFPETTEEIAQIMALCHQHSVPVIPFGAGTSLEGHVNAPRGGLSLDLSRMAQVLAVNAQDLDCVVQPGVTRKQLNTHLRDQGLFFPIDPGADATLGGMASTRASGTNAVRYGTMRDAVLSLEAVLPDGTVIRTGRRARKSSAGYDLTRLMVGAEGTLGVITELTLRLHGIPEAMSSATCSFPDVDRAAQAVMATIQMGLPMARIELLDSLSVRAVNAYSRLDLPESPLLLLEFHGSHSAVAEQAESFGEIAEEFGGTGFTWTTSAEERTKLWQARHDAYWAAMALEPGCTALSTDICVPISRLAEAIDAAVAQARQMGLTAPVVGHVGDGNFHMLLLLAPGDAAAQDKAKRYIDWLSALALSMDGTCTGEHGIGQGKQQALRQEMCEALGMMRAIKQAVDPKGIMNPGKILEN